MEVKQQAFELIKSFFSIVEEHLFQEATQRNNFFFYNLWKERYYTYLETSDLYRITKLDLSMLGIEYLMPEFGYLSTLEELNIVGNMIPELPDSLWDLYELKALFLGSPVFGGNPIKEIPSKIKNLKKLETLDISSCDNLTSLPKELLEIENLLYLRLTQEDIYQSDVVKTLREKTECCVLFEETLPPIIGV